MNKFSGEDIQHEFKGHRNFTNEQIPLISANSRSQRPISRYYFDNLNQSLHSKR